MMDILAASIYVVTSGIVSGLLISADLVLTPANSGSDLRRRILLSPVPLYVVTGFVVVFASPELASHLLLTASAVNVVLLPVIVNRLRQLRRCKSGRNDD